MRLHDPALLGVASHFRGAGENATTTSVWRRTGMRKRVTALTGVIVGMTLHHSDPAAAHRPARFQSDLVRHPRCRQPANRLAVTTCGLIGLLLERRGP